MNKAYRLVWDELRGMLVIVAENSRCRGKKAGKTARKAALVAPVFALTLAASGGEARAWVCQTISGDSSSGYYTETYGHDESQNGIACGLQPSASGAKAAGDQPPGAYGKNTIALGTDASAGIFGTLKNPNKTDAENSIAVGTRAQASRTNNIAVGTEAFAMHENSLAAGAGAKAYPKHSTAIGSGAVVGNRDRAKGVDEDGKDSAGKDGTPDSGVSGVAIGRDAKSGTLPYNADTPNNKWTTAIGARSSADGNGAIALGGSATQDTKWVSKSAYEELEKRHIKNWETATDTEKNAAHYYDPTTAYGRGAIAIGNAAYSAGFPETAAGLNLSDDDKDDRLPLGQTIAIGQRSMAIAEQSIAIGAESIASGGSSIAIGGDDVGSGQDAADSKLWDSYNATKRLKEALEDGKLATALELEPDQYQSTTLQKIVDNEGYYQNTTRASGGASIALGMKSEATGDLSNAFGMGAIANAESSMAIGSTAHAEAKYATAVGTAAFAKGERSNAFGMGAAAIGESSIALGSSAAKEDRAVAIGDLAIAKEQDAVALGSAAVADRMSTEKILKTKAGTAETTGYNVIDDAAHSGAGAGTSTWTPTLSAVSVGSAPARLYATDSSLSSFTTDPTDFPVFLKSDGTATLDYMDPTTYKTYEVAYAGENNQPIKYAQATTATRRITNVAAGSADTDAVNVAQLKLVRENSWQVGGNLVQDDDGDIIGSDGNKYKYEDGDPIKIKQGDVVNFVDGDGTTAVTSNTTIVGYDNNGDPITINQPSVTYNVNKTPVQPNADTGTAYGWCADASCNIKLAWDGANYVNPDDGSTYTGDVFVNGEKVDKTTSPNNLVTAGDVVNTINNTYWIAEGGEGVVDGTDTTHGEVPIRAGNKVTFTTDGSVKITQTNTKDANNKVTGTVFDFKGMTVTGDNNGTATKIYAPNEDGDWEEYNIGGGSWTIGNPDTNQGSSTGDITVSAGDRVNFKDGTGTTVTIQPADTTTGTPAYVAYNVDRDSYGPTNIISTGNTAGKVTNNPADPNNPVENKYWDSSQVTQAINDSYWKVQGFNGATAAPTSDAGAAAGATNGQAEVHASDTVNLFASEGLLMTQDNTTGKTDLTMKATYAYEDKIDDPNNPGTQITVTKVKTYNPDGSESIYTIAPNQVSLPVIGITSSGGKIDKPVNPSDPNDETYGDRPVTAGSVATAVNATYWTAKDQNGDSFNVNPSNKVTFQGGTTTSTDSNGTVHTGSRNIQVVATPVDPNNDTGEYALNVNLSDNIGLSDNGSVTIGGTTINNGNINFTKEDPANPGTTIPGGGTITGVDTHLVGGDTTINGADTPDKFDDAKRSEAATVGDVMNAGWNLKAQNQDVDYVTHGDTVHFTSSNESVKITPSRTTADSGDVSTIDFSVDTSSIQNSIVNNAFDNGEGTNYEIVTDPKTGKPVVKFNVNKATLDLKPGEGVTAFDEGGTQINAAAPNYATAGEVADKITQAAQKYKGDTGEEVRPGVGGTLPLRGWSAEQDAAGNYLTEAPKNNWTSPPITGGYSGYNLQVVPAKGSNGGLAVQMSENPTFRNKQGEPTVQISGDQGTVTAGNVKMGNQTIDNSVKVGGGGPNPTTGNYVTGLDNKQWRTGSYVSGRAATEDQLQAVAESAEYSFSGDRNINVGRSGNHVSIRLNPNLVQPDYGSVNVGDPWGGGEYTRMDIDGIKISNGPSMTRSGGINAGGMTITNVAPGVYDDDAVNVGQLRRLEGKMNKMGDRADAGIAGAMAAAAVPQVTVAGKNLLGAGAGYFHDQSAVAVGYSAMSDNGKWIMRANASVSTEEASASAGVGYQW